MAPGKVMTADPRIAARADVRIHPTPEFLGLNLRLKPARLGPDNEIMFKNQRADKCGK